MITAINPMSIRLACIRVILIASILAAALVNQAYAKSPEVLAENIRDAYAEINSIGFSFSQTTAGQLTGRAKTGKGTALFARMEDRHLMRWNYIHPDPQVVISDGTTISMYFEKLNQMIVTSVDQAQADILFSFFTAEEPLTNTFAVLPPAPEKNGDTVDLQVLQLQPLDNDTQIRSIHLWIDEGSIIRRIELLDYFDTKTTINLSNIEINLLDQSDTAEIIERFTFIPPAGTEIIRQ